MNGEKLVEGHIQNEVITPFHFPVRASTSHHVYHHAHMFFLKSCCGIPLLEKVWIISS